MHEPDHGHLPPVEFAFPGPLRDALVAAILDGGKTSTSALLAEYMQEGAPLPAPGTRGVVLDSDGNGVAVIETTDVDVVRLGDVPLRHAIDEGEGFRSVAEWRDAHLGFSRSPELVEALPGLVVDDDTLVVLERFGVVDVRVDAPRVLDQRLDTPHADTAHADTIRHPGDAERPGARDAGTGTDDGAARTP
ncbi:ASCH domain-containing protein [Pseudoclavibacter chungangensis]|uniref:ASCH domain-containing protein n=1 Tax=Pseudoclavibacter chungangensis TaxID=587635 RepID=A0A7J5BP81_9MICO|nr:ASCH domain-containing protein [Pseudoclavibacter chungangensis]KAB1654528.1 ASCH domain-containing protein [Pseudoclavibacter chungangensis]NYJ68247.1 uncharacterized protein YhfF [Pseudoclavibacter chungangensis]